MKVLLVDRVLGNDEATNRGEQASELHLALRPLKYLHLRAQSLQQLAHEL